MKFRHVLMTEHFFPVVAIIKRVSIVIQFTDQIRATGNVAGVTLLHERLAAQPCFRRINNASYVVGRSITESSTRATAATAVSSAAIAPSHAHHGTGTFQLHQRGDRTRRTILLAEERIRLADETIRDLVQSAAQLLNEGLWAGFVRPLIEPGILLTRTSCFLLIEKQRRGQVLQGRQLVTRTHAACARNEQTIPTAATATAAS